MIYIYLQFHDNRASLTKALVSFYLLLIMKIILPVLLFCLYVDCKKNSAPASQVIRGIDILARGVNLSNWFNDYSDPSQYATRFSLSTLQLIKKSGFTYVRIPVGV